MLVKDGKVQIEQIDKTGVIRFNDPPLNIGIEQSAEFVDAISWAEEQSELHALVFTSTGKVFGAGADMNNTYAHLQKGDFISHSMRFLNILNDRISKLPMPTFCAIDGAAYGGVLEFALACDFRILAPHVTVSLSEIKFGSFPGAGGTHRCVELMGYSKAAEQMFFAKTMTAEEAVQNNIANAVAYDKTAFDLAMEMAKGLEDVSLNGIHAVKAALIGTRAKDLDYYLDNQLEVMQRHVVDTGELERGALAFLERKKAKQQGK